MYSNSIIIFIYTLINRGIKIWKEDNKIKLFVPEGQILEDKDKDFINNNYVYILDCLEINQIYSKHQTPILRINQDEPPALSFSQERLWFIEKYENGTNAYNISAIFRLSTNTNLKALENSIKAVVSRHEILRTVIKEDLKGNSHSYVLPVPLNLLSIIEVNNLEALHKELLENSNYIFDLNIEYPIRVVVVSLDNTNYLSIVIHHIAYDGWSIDIFFQEIYQYYQHFCYSSPINLSPLTIQYKDFAVWQKQYLSGKLLEQQIKFWKDKLIDYEALKLPLDKPRPEKINYQGANQYFSIDLNTSISIRNLAKKLNVSLYTVLVSAYCLMLRIYSNQNDLIIGTPVANRHYNTQVQSLIGFFVNSIVLRIKVTSSQTVFDFIKQVGKDNAEAQNNQDIPFEKLVDELKLPKDMSCNPIFQTMFGLQGFETVVENNPNLKQIFEEYKLDNINDSAKFDLSMFIDDSQDFLEGVLNYATSLYEKATAQNLISIYTLLLKQFTQLSSTDKISDIKYLTPEQSLKQENDNKVEYRLTINELFEEQVAAAPQNLAVVYKNKVLSYKELNEKANRLANYLVDNFNIKPDTLIGLCLDRSENMLISILAILKVGACYVPISPDYPTDRIRYIVEDTKAELIITTKAFTHRTSEAIRLVIDDPLVQQLLDTYSIKSPNIKLDCRNLAYVIYTSGTTGRPKGVMIEHRNAVNYILNIKKYISISTIDIVDFSTNISFDLTVTNTICALCLGAKIAIFNDELSNFDSYVKHLITNDVTTIKLVPSYFELLIDFLPRTKINKIILGGEKLSAGIIQRVFALKNNNLIKIYDEYGPTETTVGACNSMISSYDSLNIGKPYDNYKAYILNAELNLVPVGGIGELYIGGYGVARGYLNRPDLTAERFIPNSLSSKDRLYKTGDLVRLLSSGEIEYIGRSDFQIKIRGHRVEPGEIESALRAYSNIKQAVVTFKDNEGITAYYTTDTEIDESKILQYLESLLPEYMVPRALMQIEEITLTINGKVNYKALPKVEVIDKLIYAPPSNELETKLVHIWADTLKLPAEKVGIKDNFFMLGGNSITAIKLTNLISTQLNTGFSISSLFKHNTIEKISNYITSGAINFEVEENLEIPKINFTKSEEQSLSFAQERLWFIDKFESGTNAYNVPMLFKLASTVNLAGLERSIRNVINKHEILRTVIKEDEHGNNYQLVLDSDKISIIEQEAVDETTLEQYFKREAHHVFDLSKDYPIKISITNIATNSKLDRYLSIVIHHIAFDGWSVEIFLKELIAYYHYFNSSIPLNLPNINIQYKDFAVWQRQYLSGVRLKQEIEYWKLKLDGHEALNLITDNSRPSKINYLGEEEHFTINKELSNFLRQTAKELGVSLYSLLLSAYFLMLKAYSNQNDIVIGTPVANRHNIQTQNLIGFFVNTLVLRIIIENQSSVKDFIKKVGEQVVEAQLHQDLPFEKLVDELKVPKDMRRHPIFQVMFGIQNFNYLDHGQGEGLMKEYKLNNVYNVSKFDFSLLIDDSNSCLNGVFNYAVALYKKETIKSFIQTYLILLDQITGSIAKLKVADLNYINREEYSKIIIDWNKTTNNISVNQTIHALFEAKAEQVPDNTAIIFNKLELTYKNLNILTNQLAHHLINEHNIKPENIVLLCLDRSENIPIAILGTLKAGGAYVPVDPSYPDDRIKFIAEDTKTTLVITNTLYESRLDLLLAKKVPVICIDDPKFQKELKKYPSNNPAVKTVSENLAYVIYTSGTTGNPKGVMVTHKGVINYKYSFSSVYGLGQPNNNETILQFTNYVFDASVAQMVLSLLNGYRLLLVPNNLWLENDKFYSYLISNQVTHISGTPTFLSQYNLGKIPTLRRVIFGGEEVNLDFYQQIKSDNIKIINAYGPTEVSIASIANVLHDHDLSIGTPVGNTAAYVLNSSLKGLPIGAVGELYIGGVGVTRGYLNRPDLTVEKFIANCFSQDIKQDRLYKTGDLARWLPNGKLQYIGRNDSQVKIRGYRVELSEIKKVIESYPGIENSVVINKEISGLVAYYISSLELDTQKIMDYLQLKLPEYMVPAVLLQIDKIPTTISGKLDKQALPEPKFNNDVSYLKPRTLLEQQIREVWSEVLRVPSNKLGIKDNFFHLGGNSILAIKLINRINKIFNLNITVASIFLHNTVEKINQYLKEGGSEQVVISKSRVNKKQDQLLSFAQERLWFIEKYEGGTNAYNIPIILKVAQNTDIKNLQNAIEKVVDRHEILRSIIQEEDIEEGNTYQVVSKQPLKISIVHLEDNQLLMEKLKQEANYIFKLDKEYPIRISVYCIKDQYFLSIVAHHISFDGWSIDLFLREIYNHYHNLPVELLNIQYKDFALWQRGYLSGEILRKQINFWKDKLIGYETLNIITDKPRPSHIDYRGAEFTFEIGFEISKKLRILARNLEVSLYSVLLSGYYLMLKVYSNQRDIVIGTPIANRHYKDIENLIGFFVNLLALRVKIDYSSTVKEFIYNVGQEIIKAQLHQDLPFEKLIEELKIPSDPSRQPLFQVMFGMQGFENALKNQTEVRNLFEEYKFPEDFYNIAKFDLTTLIDDSDENLKGTFNYALSLYEENTIVGFVKTYKEILEQLANLIDKDNADLRISSLRYLTKKEYEELVNETSRLDCKYGALTTINTIFEQQAFKNPNNIAVTYRERKLTYEELNEKANRLANYIIKVYQIKLNDLIALCLDRDENIIISILAILKAGGAYVPIDPSYPVERIKYIIDDTKAKLLIANEKYTEILKGNANILTIDSAKLARDLLRELPLNPRPAVLGSSLAYVLYTSGTTGNPKGVMIEHKSYISLIRGIQGLHFGDKKSSIRTYSITNYVFDIFGLEYGIPLLSSGEVELGSIEFESLDCSSYDFIQMTPSICEVKLDNFINTSSTKLILGGEPLTQELLSRSLIKFKNIINAYGPTETTIWSSTKLYSDDLKKPIEIIVGKALPNEQIYILDANLEPLPIGAIGEIYIGGIGVARGYLNKPDLTAESFIANQFKIAKDKESWSKLYKTGDLGVKLPNREIKYLGRNDFQVKVRGFRIELGEIEKAISSYEGIKQSAAIVDNNCNNIIGYYVSDHELEENLILQYLISKLPEYMVPNRLIFLSKLPLSVNGKLDKKLLPVPNIINIKNYVGPRTPLEKQLANIWSVILKLPSNQISVYDDFFKLGGNSLLSVKLTAKVKQDLKVNINIKDIFVNKTIEALAQKLNSLGNNTPVGDFEPYVRYTDGSKRNILFMFPPGNGGAESYFNNLVPQLNDLDLVIFNNYYLYLQSKSGKAIGDNISYEELTNQYIKYIKSLQSEGPYYLFGWSFGGVLALETARQLTNMNDVVGNIFIVDSFFNYKMALENTKFPTEVFVNNINYRYSPILTEKNLEANITLFKATVVDKQEPALNEDIEEYYIKLLNDYYARSKDNHLDTLGFKKFKKIIMNYSHLSWINDNQQVTAVSKEIIENMRA